jgi:LacI family transcriptional regulator
MPRKKNVTLNDIAKELGVSRFTVSKALHGKPGMSMETRRAILELVVKQGYMTMERQEAELFEHTALTHLHNRRRFCLITTADEHAFIRSFPELLQGITERFVSVNYELQLTFIPPIISGGSEFEQWVEEHNILYSDGIFIPPSMPPLIEEKLLALPIPRILINFPAIGAKVDSVIWDVQDAVRHTARYLLEAGHERILYIGGNSSIRGFKLRWSAFIEVMSDAGITVVAQEHLILPQADLDQWVGAFERCVQAYRPTAILNSLGHYLPWIYYASGLSKLNIPIDCSLASLGPVDSSMFDQVTRPVFALKETGYRAAERMIWRIANPHQPYEHIRLQNDFHKGQTVYRVDGGALL